MSLGPYPEGDPGIRGEHALVDAHRYSSALRRAAGALLTVGLLIAAVAYFRMVPPGTLASGPAVANTSAVEPTLLPPSSEPPTTSAPPSTAKATPTPTPARSPRPTLTTTTLAPPSDTAPEDLPEGPGTTLPGILLIALPNADGSFEVWESVRLAAPVNVVILEPIDPGALGGSVGETRPRAQRVQVTAGDQPVMLPSQSVAEPTEVSMDRPATRIALRYQLRDSTVRSTRSTAGRALGALGSMVSGVPDDLPVAIMVRGRSVRNLLCPTEPLSERACASGQAPNMRVNRPLPRRASVIGVQFDLGVPR